MALNAVGRPKMFFDLVSQMAKPLTNIIVVSVRMKRWHAAAPDAAPFAAEQHPTASIAAMPPPHAAGQPAVLGIHHERPDHARERDVWK
jgi:hypothetical protein